MYTILPTISERLVSPKEDFYSKFQSYVMQVQDTNLDTEVSFFCRNKFLPIIELDKTLNDMLKELD